MPGPNERRKKGKKEGREGVWEKEKKGREGKGQEMQKDQNI